MTAEQINAGHALGFTAVCLVILFVIERLKNIDRRTIRLERRVAALSKKAHGLRATAPLDVGCPVCFAVEHEPCDGNRNHVGSHVERIVASRKAK